MTLDLTDRQAMVLAVIRAHYAEYGAAPTLREIGRQLGINSTNGVNDHLKALERKGFIERRDKIARSIRLTDYGLGKVGWCPTCGRAWDGTRAAPPDDDDSTIPRQGCAYV